MRDRLRGGGRGEQRAKHNRQQGKDNENAIPKILAHKDSPVVLRRIPCDTLRRDYNIHKTGDFSMNLSRFKPLAGFLAIFLLGAIARAWQFGTIPPGISADEASIGLDAYYLLTYGVDRYGMSYPVHLISWGSGQNALYAYLIMPVIALNELNIDSIRLPMLVAGILSLPLIYLVGRKIVNEQFGLIAMFLLAISPWHVIASRWAVESNIFPFVFLAGFTLFLYSDNANRFFVAACASFGLSMYAYGTSYAAVPIFLSISVPLWIYTKRMRFAQAILGLGVFLLVSLPILVFIAVNVLSLPGARLGSLTIPRLPVEARYISLGSMFDQTPLQKMGENAQTLWRLLWTQTDDFAWNRVKPFGYFYTVTFPLALLGLSFSLARIYRKTQRAEYHLLLLAWLLASVCIGLINPVNLTRVNLIFTPLILYIGLFLFELKERIPPALPVGGAVLLLAFFLFQRAYYGTEHQRKLRVAFNSGIIPAIEFAVEKSEDAAVCFTETVPSSYVYVLFSQKPGPSALAQEMRSAEWLYPFDYPQNPARYPRQLGQFHFKTEDCKTDPNAMYILLLGETPPTDLDYRIKKFDRFQVYLPKE
ncbi:MAG: hypothetical protein DCC59_00550 [Chloroflexi bacterium]|nr:MAG: hypothetical protein DCC59_00550 [Chloroflexota bacterium]